MSALAKKMANRHKPIPSTVISLRIRNEYLDVFDKFCKEKGIKRATLLNLFIANIEDIYADMEK